MKRILVLLLAIATGCHHSAPRDTLSLIQIQDRNGLTETISQPDRLVVYNSTDFTSSQPYKKVLRVYKMDGKNHSKLTTYHPNGSIHQYLEAEEMRAHGTYKEWFPSGKLKIEATVIGGTADVSPGAQEDWLFDSTSQVWDEHGNLIAKIPYKKGMLDGTSVYYYPSGQVEREVPFEKNDIEGEAVEYFPDGTLKSKSLFKKGMKEGETLSFFSDGKLASVEDYRDGCILTGTYYSPHGDLVSEIRNGGGFQAIYENKALTLIEHRVGQPDGRIQKFTPAGELQKSLFIKNGKRQGEELEFYLSSQLDEGVKSDKPLPKLSVTWHENMIHGPVKTWYSNGKLQSQREYSRNHRSGPSLAWYRDGGFMMIEEYEEDRLVSGQYFKMNKAEPVSSIQNGSGLATLYDETGSFLRKITYVKGKVVDLEK